MKSVRWIFAIACLANLISCDNWLLKKDASAFVGTEITIPRDLQETINGIDTDETLLFDSKIKMILYFDSTRCSPCLINQIYKLKQLREYTISYSDKFRMIFIFTPKKAEIHQLYIALKTYEFNFPMYIDKTGEFIKLNPTLPSNHKLHTFLMNEDNRVDMVGIVVGNDRLWHMYENRIKVLISD